MAISLDDLTSGAMDLADMVSNPIVATATWHRWANRGIERLYRLLIPYFSSAFEVAYTVAVTGGTAANATTELPANFRSLVHVSKDPTSPSLRRAIRRFNVGEKESQGDIRYRLTTDVSGVQSLLFEPYITSAGTYEITYTVGPRVLTFGSDEMDPVLEPGAEFVETYMAVKALGKEESETTDLRRDLSDMADELVVLFAGMDSAEPATITDVYNTGGVWPAWRR